VSHELLLFGKTLPDGPGRKIRQRTSQGGLATKYFSVDRSNLLRETHQLQPHRTFLLNPYVQYSL
jgi:hypothetical protein